MFMVQHVFYSQHASNASHAALSSRHDTHGKRLAKKLGKGLGKRLSKELGHCLLLSLLVTSSIVDTTAFAAPSVTVIEDGTTANSNGNTNGNPNGDAPTSLNSPDSLNVTTATPVDTLASQQPSESQLSAANQTLLTQNAKLQREVNDLQTQVNVLIHERSGQLYLYGVFTVIVSLFVGFGLGMFVFRQRDRW